MNISLCHALCFIAPCADGQATPADYPIAFILTRYAVKYPLRLSHHFARHKVHTMSNTTLILNNTPATEQQLADNIAAMRLQNRKVIPDIATRRARLKKGIRLLTDNQDALVAAFSSDYGHRSQATTLISDILGSVDALHHAEQHLESWMQSETRESPFPGVHARIDYRPLGVVGVISPWNFPLVLAFGPLAGIFAAGNVAMLKPSSTTPAGSALLCELIARYFDEDEFSTLQGSGAGSAFSAQAFDHMMFTGSTETGRKIMQAASATLTPVTLELGGKSPAVIGKDADIRIAAERIMTVKMFNAGQICICPDYVLVPEEKKEAFIREAQHFVTQHYPTLLNNPDYTAVINVREYQRLQGYITQARERGADIVEINPAGEVFDEQHHKLPPTLIVNPPRDTLAMTEEIFGPLLPVVTYKEPGECVELINARPNPLAAYYFGEDREAIHRFQQSILSGAIVINDVMSHVLHHDVPFGGVGASGMGAYHGIEGFRRFSHAQPVIEQSPQGESNLLMRAPYNGQTLETIASLLAQAD
ncbi:coniferyl aldehyde dehydrogenase [Erwinia sp. HDF1-3R]|uniref:coniferyl aldehyde dehydrogenase n=1 Tax=Erwinia sp. HDF1-3R TaxID=3141543 RepID=UPI0031F5CF5E